MSRTQSGSESRKTMGHFSVTSQWDGISHFPQADHKQQAPRCWKVRATFHTALSTPTRATASATGDEPQRRG